MMPPNHMYAPQPSNNTVPVATVADYPAPAQGSAAAYSPQTAGYPVPPNAPAAFSPPPDAPPAYLKPDVPPAYRKPDAPPAYHNMLSHA